MKKKYSLIIINILLIILLTTYVNADLSTELDIPGDAGYPAAFLYLPVGAKAIAMGGGFVVGVYDQTSAFYNPAALINIKYGGVSLTGSSLSLDRYHNAGVIAFKNGDAAAPSSVIALSGIYTFVDGIYPYVDDTGVASGGAVTFGSFMGQLSMAFSLAPKVPGASWGFSIKGITQSIDDETAYGIAADFGAEFRVVIFKIGVAVKNLGIMAYSSKTLWLRPQIIGGINLKLPGLPVPLIMQIDQTVGIGDGPKFRLATEFTVFDTAPKDDIKGYDTALKNFEKKQLGNLLQKQPESTPGRGVALTLRLALADGNLSGGFTLRVNTVEVSYALAMDVFDERLGHIVSVNYNF